MARPDPLTEQARMAFLAALRGGALVAAAAAVAGVPLSTLYRRRGLDPLFDLAWSAAARLSKGPGSKRRVRFEAADKTRFLHTLPDDCNGGAAAGRIGFHPCTVHRHLRRDPDFATGKGRALRSGFARLARRRDEARAASRERLGARLDSAPAADVRGEDFDSLTRRLDRYTRPDGSIGDRKVLRPAARNVWSFERAIVELDRQLDALGGPRVPWRPAAEGGEGLAAGAGGRDGPDGGG